MILFKIFRFLLVLFFALIIFIISFLFYIDKKYLTDENIKNYLIYRIYEKTNLIAHFSSIKFSNPDNIAIEGLIIYDTNNKPVIKAKRLKININMAGLIKDFKISLDSIHIENADIELYKKNGELNIKLFNGKTGNENFKIGDITVENTKLNLIDFDSNKSYTITIKNMEISKNFIFDRISLNSDFEYESDMVKKINIETSIDIPLDFSYIEINWLKTKIKNKLLELKGRISNFNESVTTLQLKTSDKINLKDFLNINKNIIIDKFNANLKTQKATDDVIKITSEIKDTSTYVELYYNLKTNKIIKSRIKSLNINIQQLKEFVNDYINDFSGLVNLEIETREEKGKSELFITANSQNLSFKDKYDILKFADSKIKLIINPSFNALNMIDAKADFHYGKITGNFQKENDGNLEKILVNLNIDDIKTKADIKIKDIKKNRRFVIDMETSKFPFYKILNIFNYVSDKINSKPSKNNSIYNMKKRPLYLIWKSPVLCDNPYISAKRVNITGDIKSFNSFNLIDGRFKIKINDGIMDNIDKNAKENKNYEIIFLPVTTIFSLNRTGALKTDSRLKSIKINEMGVDFYLNNAKIIVDKFYMDSKEFLIYSKGEIDFKNEDINMKVYIINRKDYKSGALPEAITDTKGRPALAFEVKGSFKKNNVKLFDASDITELVEREVSKGL